MTIKQLLFFSFLLIMIILLGFCRREEGLTRTQYEYIETVKEVSTDFFVDNTAKTAIPYQKMVKEIIPDGESTTIETIGEINDEIAEVVITVLSTEYQIEERQVLVDEYYTKRKSFVDTSIYNQYLEKKLLDNIRREDLESKKELADFYSGIVSSVTCEIINSLNPARKVALFKKLVKKGHKGKKLKQRKFNREFKNPDFEDVITGEICDIILSGALQELSQIIIDYIDIQYFTAGTFLVKHEREKVQQLIAFSDTLILPVNQQFKRHFLGVRIFGWLDTYMESEFKALVQVTFDLEDEYFDIKIDEQDGVNYVNVYLPEPQINEPNILDFDLLSKSILGNGHLSGDEVMDLHRGVKSIARDSVAAKGIDQDAIISANEFFKKIFKPFLKENYEIDYFVNEENPETFTEENED